MAVDEQRRVTPWRLLARSLSARRRSALTRGLGGEAAIASVKLPKRIPPRFPDPHLRDIDILGARPDPLIRIRRKAAVDQPSDQARVKAV